MTTISGHDPGAGASRVAFLTVWLAVLLFVAVLAFARPAQACPSCAAGQQARSEVLQEGFGENLLVSLLPFVLIGGICLRAEEIGKNGH